MKQKYNMGLYISVLSLIISLLSIGFSTPYLYDWFMRPKLVFYNSNHFLTYKKDGQVLIKNNGKGYAKDLVVSIILVNEASDIEEIKNASFSAALIKNNFSQENNIIRIKPTTPYFINFPIKEIPPNQIVNILYTCDKSCSTEVNITYSGGSANGEADTNKILP